MNLPYFDNLKIRWAILNNISQKEICNITLFSFYYKTRHFMNLVQGLSLLQTLQLVYVELWIIMLKLCNKLTMTGEYPVQTHYSKEISRRMEYGQGSDFSFVARRS